MDALAPAVTRRGIPLFFGLWYALVVVTNTTDLLRVAGLLPERFGWTSGNYALVVGHIGATGAASVVVHAVYLLGVVWELTIAALMLRAARADRPEATRAAFTAALAFWAVFLLGDEAALAYRFGDAMTAHFVIFLTHAAGLLVADHAATWRA